MDKPLVIYHGNCADGFGAAWVFHSQGSFEEYEFYPGVYQEAPPDVTGRDVYLVDFSYKRPVIEAMMKVAKHITLIDHHKSAIEDLKPLYELPDELDDCPRISAMVDTEHSGAMLAWQHFRGSDEPPALLKHIEDRDLWRFKLPYTREIQANLFSYPYDFAVWDELMTRPVEDLIVEGTAIERKHHKDIKELLVGGVQRMVIGGHQVPVVNLPYIFSSDAGHILAENEPFAGCYWDTSEGRIFSLRSREDGIDVSGIAKIYGGGGHKHAAGFKLCAGEKL